MSFVIASDKRSFELEVDLNVYSLEVCKKACYALMAHISCNLEISKSQITIKAAVSGEYPEDVEQIKEI